MTKRITNKDLEHYEKILNEALGRPTEYWDDLKREAKPGHIHTRGENGYTNINVTCNTAGGISGLAYGLTKREAYEWLKACYCGVTMKKEAHAGS